MVLTFGNLRLVLFLGGALPSQKTGEWSVRLLSCKFVFSFLGFLGFAGDRVQAGFISSTNHLFSSNIESSEQQTSNDSSGHRETFTSKTDLFPEKFKDFLRAVCSRPSGQNWDGARQHDQFVRQFPYQPSNGESLAGSSTSGSNGCPQPQCLSLKVEIARTELVASLFSELVLFLPPVFLKGLFRPPRSLP